MNLEPREETANEEIANTLSHSIGAIFGFVGVIILIMSALALGAKAVVISCIYGLTFFLTYLSSTLYHSSTNKKHKKFYRLVDTCFIFLFIIGTNLPFLLLLIPPDIGIRTLILLLAAGGIGIICKILGYIYDLGERFNFVYVIVYVIMGWSTLVMAGVPLFEMLPAFGFNLLLAGGVAYTIGVVFYMMRDMPYNHAVWHVFCVGGSICHYFTILWYIL